MAARHSKLFRKSEPTEFVNFYIVLTQKVSNFLLRKVFIYKYGEITMVTQITSAVQPRIAVIDVFNDKTVDIDGFKGNDISHGKIIVRFLREGLPNAEISKFSVPGFDNRTEKRRKEYAQALENHLQYLVSQAKSGKKYDAVNISLATLSTYRDEEGETPANVKSRCELIKSNLSKMDEHSRDIGRCIALIEVLSNLGTKVYIAAGNENTEKYNIFNVAKGAINVGALNKDRTKEENSCDNSLVNRWVRGVFPVTKTDDGIDFTGDGTTDIDYFDLSGVSVWKDKLSHKEVKERVSLNGLMNSMSGTSFAVPTAIVEDFKNLR